MGSLLKQFAEHRKLRLRKGEDSEPYIPGRDGIIYDYLDGKRLALLLSAPGTRKWPHRRRTCVTAGMVVLQDGEDEGTLLFDPKKKEQADVAVRVVGARRRRQLTEEHRQRLLDAGRRFHFRREDQDEQTIGLKPAT